MPFTMTRREREEFLSGVHVGVVSIPRPGRGPLTVPIWYDYEPGSEVWMLTGPDSLKGQLLLNAERISLCAQTETAPYKYVSVEGPFTTTSATPDSTLHMAIRYLGEEGGKRYVESMAPAGESMVVRIRPETWLTVDYGKR